MQAASVAANGPMVTASAGPCFHGPRKELHPVVPVTVPSPAKLAVGALPATTDVNALPDAVR